MNTDPRDAFVSLNPLGLGERELQKDSTGFADMRTHNDYLLFLAGYKAGAVDAEERGYQRHHLMNAEGCKPEISITLSGMPCAGAAVGRSLNKAEGGTTDSNTPRLESPEALREDIERGKRIQLAMALDLASIAEALGISPQEQKGGAGESIKAILEMQERLWNRDALLSDLLDHDISIRSRFCIQEAMSSDDDPSTLSRAAIDLLAERRRQIRQKGYDAARDDQYGHRELTDYAVKHALLAAGTNRDWPHLDSICMWEVKYSAPRRMLIKAAALLLAALESLDRKNALGVSHD